MRLEIAQQGSKAPQVWLLPDGATAPVYLEEGSLEPGKTLWLAPRQEGQRALLLAKPAGDGAQAVREAAGEAAQYLHEQRQCSCELVLAALPEALLPPALEGFILGAHRVTRYRSKPFAIEVCHVGLPAGMEAEEGRALLQRVQNTTGGVLLARELVADTASELTPLKFADRLCARFKETTVQVEILQGEELAQQGFAGLPAVGKGSDNPPCLVQLRLCTDPAAPLVALVGKGVTFDMGGMNVKTGADLSDARFDMGGAAAVAGAFAILAHTGVKANLLGLLPCTENLPDARALLPGEVLRFMDGTTVQITNTDAEGRLLLADALLYAQKLGANTLVDAATLTGNVGMALGTDVAAVLGADSLCEELLAAGQEVGDALWRLPLVQHYTEEMQSDYADIKSTANGPMGGCIKAALFLQHFIAPGAVWAHIDMANTAQAQSAHGYYPAGPTGYGAALLAQFVRRHTA